MAKPNFDSIDPSRQASPRQISAIANRFAKLTNPKDSYMLTKRYNGILYRFQEESGKTFRHGDIQKFFACRKVPKNFVDMLETPEESEPSKPKPKASAKRKTSTKSPKPSTKAPSEDSELKALKAQVADLNLAVQRLIKQIS